MVLGSGGQLETVVPPAAEVTDLGVSFPGGGGIQSLSLRVEADDCILIVGPSGCGKSTLLNCLMGFCIPDGGDICVMGQQLTSRTVWSIRSRVAYVAQEPDLGDGTVRDVLARPFSYRCNRSLSYHDSEANELLEAIGFERSILNKSVKSLSGGEKQRVALVGALLLKRKLYLLDEITSALDAPTAILVADLLQSLEDVAVVVATHQPDSFASWKKSVSMTRGRERAVE